MKVKGVVKGQTIVCDQLLTLLDGQRVEIEVHPIENVDIEKFGFKVIPSGGNLVTNEMVNELRDELGI